MVDYIENREAVHTAEEISPEFHPHIVGVPITHISKVKPPSKSKKAPRVGKKVVMAKTMRVSDKMRAVMSLNAPNITPPYFIIEYDDAVWQKLTDKAKKALVDHELKHCGNDADGTYLVPHGIEDWGDVTLRNGLWKSDIKDFVETTAPLVLEGE